MSVTPSAVASRAPDARKLRADPPTGLKKAIRKFEGSTNSENSSFSKAGAMPNARAKSLVILGTSSEARIRWNTRVASADDTGREHPAVRPAQPKLAPGREDSAAVRQTSTSALGRTTFARLANHSHASAAFSLSAIR